MRRRFVKSVCENCKDLEDEKAQIVPVLAVLREQTDKLYERWKYYDESMTIDDLYNLKERIKQMLRSFD